MKGRMERYGVFKTKAGSVVEITKHFQAFIRFDWLEENACIDCEVCSPEWNGEAYELAWNCDICGGGFAILTPKEEQ